MISISFIYLSYILEALLKFQEQGFLVSDMLRRTEPFETINDVVSQKVRIGIMPGKKSISISEALEYPLTYYTAVLEKSVLRNIFDSKRSLKVQNRDELFLVLKNNKHISFLTLTSHSKNPDFCYIPIIENEYKMNICAIFLSDTTLTKQEIELVQFFKNTVHFI